MAAADKSDTASPGGGGRGGKKWKKKPGKNAPFSSRKLQPADPLKSLRDPSLARQRLSYVLSALKNSTYFQRYGGKDHFFIEDDSPYFSWKHSVYFWRDFHDLCKECSTVTPDTTASLREKYKDVITPSTVIAAPHPSAAHFFWYNKDVISPPPWARDFFHHRRYLVSTVGTVHKADWSATRIRFILEAQCKVAETKTMPLNPYMSNYARLNKTTGEENLGKTLQVCKQNYLSRNSYKSFQTVDALAIYRDSIFCLCAPGDLEVRKALFDIVGTGCIPVVFHNSTVGEYIEYIPNDIALDEVVVSYGFDGLAIRKLDEIQSQPLIPPSPKPSSEESISASFNVIDHLETFYRTQPDKIRRMQRNIERLGYRFTYSKTHHCDEKTLIKGVFPYDRSKVFAPPREDAWDLLLKILYKRNAEMKKQTHRSK